MKLPIKFSNVQKGLECLNCGRPLEGHDNFCPQCGQKNNIKKLSFNGFLNQMVSGFLSYDSRFWRTFIPLIIKPGKVSKDYIEGKRSRYVNPFRLYLNVSIIFFLFLGIQTRFSNEKPINIQQSQAKLDSLGIQNVVVLDSLVTRASENLQEEIGVDSSAVQELAKLGRIFPLSKTFKTDTVQKPYQYHIKSGKSVISLGDKLEDFDHFSREHPQLGPDQAIDSLGYPKKFWNSFYYIQLVKSREKLQDIVDGNWKKYVKTLTSYISISLFIFLPLFTLFLHLLYLRKSYNYMEHLVFVFNTQTVFFLLLIFFYLFDLIAKTETGTGIFILIFLIYLYLALRNFYEQGRFKTFIKFLLLNGFYLSLAGVGMIIVAILTFLID